MNCCSFVIVLLSVLVLVADAFQPSTLLFSRRRQFPLEQRQQQQQQQREPPRPPRSDGRSTELFVASETFYRAVECAERNNLCKIDELDRLANELEEFVGCTFEADSTQESCDKEIQGRIDVAEILRLQIDLRQKTDIFLKGNLFVNDVKQEHDIEERQKFKKELVANLESNDPGSDLGLW